ncbi:MAG: 5-carboxymethyl-2-hydroxymuconate isomerase [Puniceicoccaceae bacterium]|nr:MAG: 5-carboxymethyl-2-hydroxymuconate isomerase [Puniceicoccaceae bacterium]
MKILRYQDREGAIQLGELRADDSVERLEGALFGPLQPSGIVESPTRLLCPLDPPTIYGIGLNYRRHAAEGGRPPPERPMIFIKANSSLQHPGAPIQLPRHLASERVDYEGELAVVIGRRCKNLSPAEALDAVFGYTIANDVSARDWQFEWGGGQFCQAKSFDTFCPLGPAVVTRDEIPDPGNLRIRTTVGGNTMQDSSTSDMIFSVAELISFLSGSKTLLPGTVILTGTPHGVGFAQKPPRFLKPGDQVEIEIEGLGRLANPVEAEPL